MINHPKKYDDQKVPQSDTADQPTASWGRDTEHSQLLYSKKTIIKVKQLALSSSVRWLQN